MSRGRVLANVKLGLGVAVIVDEFKRFVYSLAGSERGSAAPREEGLLKAPEVLSKAARSFISSSQWITSKGELTRCRPLQRGQTSGKIGTVPRNLCSRRSAPTARAQLRQECMGLMEEAADVVGFWIKRSPSSSMFTSTSEGRLMPFSSGYSDSKMCSSAPC